MSETRKIMVTGCNGQLGRAIKQVYEKDADISILGTDVPDLDITDLKAVRAYVKENTPDAIINCAAATNVDGCEKDTDLACTVTSTSGSKIIAFNKYAKLKATTLLHTTVPAGVKTVTVYKYDA